MFSRRLDWHVPGNALSERERQLRAQGRDIVDLTVSNPTAVGLPDWGPALAAALADPAVAAHVPAPLGAAPARRLIAQELARQGATTSPDDIVLSASSSESYAWLFKLLCDPGDVVLVPRPSYPLFDYLARLEGVRCQPYQLGFDGEWHIDWRSLAGAIGQSGVRAVIVVNPNNPTGSFLRAHELARLAAVAATHDVALIVDEVFADYADAPAADAVRTVTAASALPALTFALGGLSKSAGLPQMKLGWMTLLGPSAAVATARAHLELIADTYLSVGTPVTSALPRLLSIGAAIRADIRVRLAENRATLARLITRALPISALRAEAGWATILRLPAVMSDEAWALMLLQEHDVLVQPGYYFDITNLGAPIVVSLLTPPEVFAAGISRIIALAA